MYTMRAVVKKVGIPAVTIRAWENRYAVLNPKRTDSGHRVYTDDDIQDLIWLKNIMNDHNISIKQATDQLKHHKQTQRKNEETPILRNKDLSIDKNPEFALEMKSRHFQSMTDNLYATLGSFKDNESDQMIEWYYDMYGYETVFHHVLIPLLKQVGDDWEGGKLSIAQEHFISQFVIRRIYGIYRLLPTNDMYPHVLAFCPSGEWHQIGLLLFCLFLRQKGVKVIYLGPDTPFDGLVEMIKVNRIKYVCVSLTNTRLLDDTHFVIEKISESYPEMKYILGGKGFEIYPEIKKNMIFLTGDVHKWNEWFEKNIRAGDRI